jgi:flagellar protein FlaI
MNLGKNIVQRLIKGYKFSSMKKDISSISVADLKKIILPLELIPSITMGAQKEAGVPQEAQFVIEGFELPQILPKLVEMPTLPEPIREKTLSYPLIPKKPAKDEPIFAYTKIFWDEKSNHYFYKLTEPELTDNLKKILNKVKGLLEEKLDIDFSKLKKFEASDYLKKEIDEILKYFSFSLKEKEKKILKYYIERDFTGLGKLEPLMCDEDIEDISCDGVGIPIFIFHRDPEIGSVITNVTFNDSDELDSFVFRIAQLCGKSVSIAQPLLDGMLPDGSRLQCTLATDIARRGSNFTIRKFTEEPLTPTHLLKFGTIDVKTLAYLWFVVDTGKSVLVSGGTASGKTSFLNVLSLFIRPEKKIISIEDTGELRLPHPHWVPTVARTAISTEGKTGEIDLFDLLKESMRQRPDYIIVGEVRGKEAYILFQQMATGHPSLATIHAENLPKLMNRLTTPPISLEPSLIESADLVIFLSVMHYKNKFVRKVLEVIEIAGFDQKTKSPIINLVSKWNPKVDKFDIVGKSFLLKKISNFTGLTEKEIRDEIERRIIILSWLQKHNIFDYVDIYKVFSLYYRDPKKLLSMIEGEF